MKIFKRGLAILLAVITVMTGIYIDAKAYTNTVSAKVNTDMLNVKIQNATDGARAVRFITSVDTLDYRVVGFEIDYEGLEEPMMYPMNQVYERIVSKDNNMSYLFGPKVVDVTSEYFATAKMNVQDGVTYTVRAYVIPFNSTEPVFGPARCVTYADGIATDSVNLTFISEENLNGTIEGVTSSVTGASTVKAEVLNSVPNADETYSVCVRVPADVNNLPSVTTFTFGSYGNAEYRNLYTTYTGSGSEDMTWYDADKDAYVIATSADLYGLAVKSASTDFAGKTVYMAADIVANNGTAADKKWTPEATNGTSYQWPTIGPAVSGGTIKAFAGTFDGNGHTVSGLYMLHSDSKYTGMFGYTAATSVIQDVRLTNSFFQYGGAAEWSKVGSIAGGGKGKFENINASATLYSGAYGTGGIIGWADGNVSISQCQFDGILRSTGNHANSKLALAGGIVGAVNVGSTIANIHDCVNNGKLYYDGSSATPRFGGIVGALNNGATLNVINSLDAGERNMGSATADISSLVGCKVSGTVTMTDSYSTHAEVSLCSNYKEGTDSNIGSMAMMATELSGVEGYIRTKLAFDDLETKEDFDGIWVATKNGTPVLRKFADKDSIQSLFGTDTEIVADRSWYDEATEDANGNAPGTTNNPYILSDAADLLAFSQISQTYNFSGKYIKLDRNIMFNASDSSTWDKTAPKNSWTPATPYAYRFAGVFDGNGYTISGLYASTTGTAIYLGLMQCTDASGQVKNLSIKNSYFANIGAGTNNNTMNEAVSSFVGSARGTLTNLYSNATLKSSVLCTGGIAGEAYNALTIRNCWFAGQIITEGKASYYDQAWAGGILGNVRSVNMTTTIEYCLNTGTHTTTATAADPRIGGIVGSKLTNATVNVNHCVSTGEIVKGSTTGVIGSIVGTILGTKTNLTNCYGTFEPIYNNAAGTVTNSGILDENAVLDTNYWTVEPGKLPQLKYFTK